MATVIQAGTVIDRGLVGLPPMAALERLYHRSRDDAFVAFGSRRPLRDGSVEPHWLFLAPVKQLTEWLPGIVEHEVSQTQYVMQNTLGRKALRAGVEAYEAAIRDGKPRYYAAKNESVYELAALVVDLDVGREEDDPTAWQAIAIVGQMSDDGVLPLPSLAAKSGRGAYLWYLLVDADGKAPLNTNANNHHWGLIINELVQRTRNLKSDPNAKRLANWYKRPGTVDTKTGNQVVYMTFGVDSPFNIPEYRLSDLMSELDLWSAPAMPEADIDTTLHVDESEPAERKRLSAPKLPKWRKGMAGNPSAPHHKRVQEIEILASARGGIHRGHRQMALVHYYRSRVAYLRIVYGKAGASQAVREAQGDTYRFNDTYCSPPKAVNNVNKAFRSWSKKKYLPRGTTIAAALGVTDDEALRLGLEAIAPGGARKARELERAQQKAAKSVSLALADEMLIEGRSLRDVEKATGLSHGTVARRRKALVDAGKIDSGPPKGQGDLPV